MPMFLTQKIKGLYCLDKICCAVCLSKVRFSYLNWVSALSLPTPYLRGSVEVLHRRRAAVSFRLWMVCGEPPSGQGWVTYSCI